MASDTVLAAPPPDVVVGSSAAEAVEVGSECTSEVDSSPSWLVEVDHWRQSLYLLHRRRHHHLHTADVVVRGDEVLVLVSAPAVDVVPAPDVGVDVSSATAIPD